jgi:hypothetical protein
MTLAHNPPDMHIREIRNYTVKYMQLTSIIPVMIILLETEL